MFHLLQIAPVHRDVVVVVWPKGEDVVVVVAVIRKLFAFPFKVPVISRIGRDGRCNSFKTSHSLR